MTEKQVKIDANDLIKEYQQKCSDLELQNMVLALQVKKLQETKKTTNK